MNKLPEFLQDSFSDNAVIGKGNIIVEIIAHSVNIWDTELITFRLHYPRFIHQELMTHRVFSRNASSSRAIPIQRMLEIIESCPAMPIHWGKNRDGMQADEELDDKKGKELWLSAMREAIDRAAVMLEAGYHKQIVNRITEPFQFMNTIVTATDFNNFFGLRLHKDAQPEIRELAYVMYEAKRKSAPELLGNGEWHTPYVKHFKDNIKNKLHYYTNEEDTLKYIELEQAKKISISAIAQASYRRLDLSLEKAEKVYDRLVTSKPVHASPTEMVATPMSEKEWLGRNNCKKMMNNGFPDRNFEQMLYERNFKGWIQERINIPDETIRG